MTTNYLELNKNKSLQSNRKGLVLFIIERTSNSASCDLDWIMEKIKSARFILIENETQTKLFIIIILYFEHN